MDASEQAPAKTQLTDSINEFITEYALLGQPRADSMDHEFKAFLARTTKGMSPLELVLAYLDWLGHLAISPGKLALMAQSLMRKLEAIEQNTSELNERIGRIEKALGIKPPAAKPAAPPNLQKKK